MQIKDIKVNIDDFEGSDIQRINTAIEFVSKLGGGIVAITRDVIITESIIIQNNVTLTFTSLIKMADATFDNIIRVAGIIPNPINPNDICLRLEETRNIKILGIGDNARIEGSDTPYTAPHPISGGTPVKWWGDHYGWRTISVYLSNCKNYEVGNFHISKTKAWAISQDWGCENGYLHDIRVDSVTGAIPNGDCIDFRNGCKNIKVERVSGKTSDDTIACTALDNTVWDYAASYIWPLQSMGYAYRAKQTDEAGIFDISIDSVSASSPYNIVDIVVAGARVQRINITNIDDAGGNNAKGWDVVGMMASFGTGFVKGNVKDIHVSNIKCHNGEYALKASLAITDCWFNNLRQLQATGKVYSINASAENIRITNS